MPAKRKIEIGDYLDITLHIEDEKSVYFTDEAVDFEIEVRNTSGGQVRGELGWFLGRGNGTIDHTNNRDRSLHIDLDAGETHKENLSTGYLTHQSNALIGVNEPGKVGQPSDGVIEISEPQKNAGNMYYQEGYSFTVWDREFYGINYTWPRRAQYASVGLAVLIILVGVVQIIGCP